MKSYDYRICLLFNNHYDCTIVLSDLSRFYVDRIRSSVRYGLYQGRELLKMVCRCAFNDSCLTDAESIAIIETCLDPRLDNILMEVNYNEGW